SLRSRFNLHFSRMAQGGVTLMCVKSLRTVVGLDAGGDADSYAFRFSFTFRMPGLEARLISEAESCRARFASLSRPGSIGRGSSSTSLPRRSTRMRNAAIRPYALLSAGIKYQGAALVAVRAIMSSIAVA